MNESDLQLIPTGPDPFLDLVEKAEREVARFLMGHNIDTQRGSSVAVAVAHAEEFYWFRRGGFR